MTELERLQIYTFWEESGFMQFCLQNERTLKIFISEARNAN